MSSIALYCTAGNSVIAVTSPIQLTGSATSRSVRSFVPAPVKFDVVLAVVSTLLSASMIALAYWIYKYRPDFARRVGDALQPVYQLLLRKYYFDDVYERVVTVQVFYGVIARVLDWFDKAIIDGTVRSVDKLGRNIGRALSLAQSGQVQGYGVFISIGVLALLGVYIFWG